MGKEFLRLDGASVRSPHNHDVEITGKPIKIGQPIFKSNPI